MTTGTPLTFLASVRAKTSGVVFVAILTALGIGAIYGIARIGK